MEKITAYSYGEKYIQGVVEIVNEFNLIPSGSFKDLILVDSLYDELRVTFNLFVIPRVSYFNVLNFWRLIKNFVTSRFSL